MDWNGANEFIFYGKGGEIATNRLDEQELAVLALHLLQISHGAPLGIGQLGVHTGRVDTRMPELLLDLAQWHTLANLVDGGTMAKIASVGGPQPVAVEDLDTLRPARTVG